MSTLPKSVRDTRRLLLLVAALATGCATAPPAPRFDAPVWSGADDGAAVATASPPPASTELDPHTSFDSPPGPVQAVPSQSANILKPYFWTAGVTGSIQAHGTDVDVDESFSDILDSLDFGFMVAYEHRFENGSSLLIDSLYIKLTEDSKVAGVDVDSQLEMGFLEVDGAFRIGDEYGIQPIVGLRGWWTSLDVDAAPVADISPSWQWLDPIVGARWRVPLGDEDKWALNFRGDMGGFGIGSACEFTWQGLAAATYAISERTNLGFGYRYLRIDREQGSGADERKTDLALSGFIAGLEFRF